MLPLTFRMMPMLFCKYDIVMKSEIFSEVFLFKAFKVPNNFLRNVVIFGLLYFTNSSAPYLICCMICLVSLFFSYFLILMQCTKQHLEPWVLKVLITKTAVEIFHLIFGYDNVLWHKLCFEGNVGMHFFAEDFISARLLFSCFEWLCKIEMLLVNYESIFARWQLLPVIILQKWLWLYATDTKYKNWFHYLIAQLAM